MGVYPPLPGASDFPRDLGEPAWCWRARSGIYERLRFGRYDSSPYGGSLRRRRFGLFIAFQEMTARRRARSPGSSSPLTRAFHTGAGRPGCRRRGGGVGQRPSRCCARRSGLTSAAGDARRCVSAAPAAIDYKSEDFPARIRAAHRRAWRRRRPRSHRRRVSGQNLAALATAAGWSDRRDGRGQGE